jgi:parvulin-like peptidyl-prolyl isomerase
MSLPAGSWSSPLRSSYGLHVVRVTEKSAGRHPTLAEVRAAVLRDWQDERRSAANAAALARLRQRYDVRVEHASSEASGLSTAAEARVSP